MHRPSLLPSAFFASIVTAATHSSPRRSGNDDIPYSPCPLIGQYVNAAPLSKSSAVVAELGDHLTEKFDKLVATGQSPDYGAVAPNTTSFAVVVFGGDASLADDPAIFEYYYTSPHNRRKCNATKVSASTKFPLGEVSMVFTVYAWLVSMGEQWEAPITKFLPELADHHGQLGFSWDDVTVGALAGHMSGLYRTLKSCMVGTSCELDAFLSEFGHRLPAFLPDTTPMVSFAAFQLLALAMQKHQSHGSSLPEWPDVLDGTLLSRLNMTSSEVLSNTTRALFRDNRSLNRSRIGEPAALSLVSTIRDLSFAGHAILSSKLLPQPVTCRWLRSAHDTSNLRNGVGRPWELYRSGATPISPMVDIATKSGALGQYSSYLGFSPDFDVGFAVLAHDATAPAQKLDLNVHVDILSESVEVLVESAARKMASDYMGTYEAADGSIAVLSITNPNWPGLTVQKLQVQGADLLARAGDAMMLDAAGLDFRLYPSNVRDSTRQQFVAVLQDKNALVDAGTPTCITWQSVGAATGLDYKFMLRVDEDGRAQALEFDNVVMQRSS